MKLDFTGLDNLGASKGTKVLEEQPKERKTEEVAKRYLSLEAEKKRLLKETEEASKRLITSLEQGENIYKVLLEACKIIDTLKGNTGLTNHAEALIKQVYGIGLREVEPLEMVISEREKRLKKMQRALKKETKATTKDQLEYSISILKDEIKRYKELEEPTAQATE